MWKKGIGLYWKKQKAIKVYGFPEVAKVYKNVTCESGKSPPLKTV